MKAACVPYFEMLSDWIYRGVITDVYSEFMVQEKTHLKKVKLVHLFCFFVFLFFSFAIFLFSNFNTEYFISKKKRKENVAEEYNNEYWTSRYSINAAQVFKMLFFFVFFENKKTSIKIRYRQF